jgi:GAF domain-containing protein/HAMP domain-containing protein
MGNRPFFERILQRSPSRFILIVVAMAQLMALIGYIFGLTSILFNADFSAALIWRMIGMNIGFILLGNVILLAITWALTPRSRQQIARVMQGGSEKASPDEVMLAWREISSLSWRYALASAPVGFLVGILPVSIYFYSAKLANSDQFIYTLIGGLIAVLSMTILVPVIIDRLLVPARIRLLPPDIDTQLSGIAGAAVGLKISIVTITMVLIGILLVAPIGYHFLAKVTFNIYDPGQIEINRQIRELMQGQSLLVAALAVILSIVLTYSISRSFTLPISSMIETFKEVEKGSMNRRAEVSATDEIGTLAIHFNRMISRLEVLQTSLEEQVKERTDQLEAINEVGRAVSAILDPDELIERVVNLITDRFGYYYSALFLTDSTGRWAELRSATGEAGRVLKESRHRLEIGGKSMVGSSIQQKRARVALDVGAEPVRFDNPLLPYTRSEIALPLVVGDQILGALDVQSTKSAAFSQRDIETLQNMANQVGVAIENARLFKETRERLEELQASQRQYLQAAWTSLTSHEETEYELGETAGSENQLDVPLTLRDQIIGQISMSADASWSTEERSWVEAVATQAAIALENARLLDQSQKNAAYEKLIADITSKIWSSNSIDGILQTSIRELGRALSATEAIIELGADEDQGINA